MNLNRDSFAIILHHNLVWADAHRQLLATFVALEVVRRIHQNLIKDLVQTLRDFDVAPLKGGLLIPHPIFALSHLDAADVGVGPKQYVLHLSHFFVDILNFLLHIFL